MWTAIFDYSFDRRRFNVPVGGLIRYVGMGKWSYDHPVTNEVSTFIDMAENVYARDTGGMKGTIWKVVSSFRESSDRYQVTLNPMHTD
jgi:hypothetical protein